VGGRESDMKESGRKKEKVFQVKNLHKFTPFKKKNKNQRGRVFSKLLSFIAIKYSLFTFATLQNLVSLQQTTDNYKVM